MCSRAATQLDSAKSSEQDPNCFPTLCACHAQAEIMKIDFKQNDLSDPGGAEAQSSAETKHHSVLNADHRFDSGTEIRPGIMGWVRR